MNPTTSNDHPTSSRRETPRDSLRALRREVSSPVIPGELTRWTRTVAGCATAVAAGLESRVAQGGLLDKTEQADPNTAHRIEPVRDRYQALHDELLTLAEELHQLLNDDRAPADEPKRYHRGEELREQLLDWCFRAETLEREARAWFGESLYRDRGVGD